MQLQDYLDEVSAAIQRQAGRSMMTLGRFVDALDALDPKASVRMGFSYEGPGAMQSYRGFYDHLALTGLRDTTVAEVLADAKAAIGKTFEGYKGGDYRMGPDTPLWWAGASNECHDTAVLGITDLDYQVIINTGFYQL